jgi:hypothetical protein
MPKRAWCDGCRSYVMLTADDMCPYGHAKPSLRAVQEVGYGMPPSEPEKQPPTDTAQYATAEFGSASATSEATCGATSTYGGEAPFPGYGAGGYGGGGYGAAYSAGKPTSTGYAPSNPIGGYGASTPAAAATAPATWQPAPADANPWQADIDAVSVDPLLQVQLNDDAARVNRTVPWSQTWIGIIVWLWLFPLIGIIFLWRSPMPTSGQKWAITGAYVGLFVLGVVMAVLRAVLIASTMAVAAHP